MCIGSARTGTGRMERLCGMVEGIEPNKRVRVEAEDVITACDVDQCTVERDARAQYREYIRAMSSCLSHQGCPANRRDRQRPAKRTQRNRDTKSFAMTLTNGSFPSIRPENQSDDKEYAQPTGNDVCDVAHRVARGTAVRRCGRADTRDTAGWVDAYGCGGWVGGETCEDGGVTFLHLRV